MSKKARESSFWISIVKHVSLTFIIDAYVFVYSIWFYMVDQFSSAPDTLTGGGFELFVALLRGPLSTRGSENEFM